MQSTLKLQYFIPRHFLGGNSQRKGQKKNWNTFPNRCMIKTNCWTTLCNLLTGPWHWFQSLKSPGFNCMKDSFETIFCCPDTSIHLQTDYFIIENIIFHNFVKNNVIHSAITNTKLWMLFCFSCKTSQVQYLKHRIC